ncbi:hypothetical protein CNMCM5793_005902 [Aspergillus hiratsukae]|uniref:Extracellular membrane protein CFEM domain-containing protein n=1 Tax=Aspergillus hiratsukae TaxID=1194566 RepID=A0A8H6P5B6_9EURO|nr:hypothetical protein CNMCM5793_005902 [Aspergillus hiratsukae]KAF7156634.1 hypothetical protein CNMCM6106_000924 [Aspergillus hiratsukae]
MVHTTSTTLLALTGLAATATAYKHTSADRMKCAAAITQNADYPTCTSPSKLDCFCAQPFDPSGVSSAARELCEGVGITTEYIPSFICRDYDSDGDDRYEVHRHKTTCHHAVAYDDDDDDSDDDSKSDGNRDIHRISHPMMRVHAPESETAEHNPNGQVQSKRAYAPGLSPSASSASAHRALVADASSSPGSKTESEGDKNENEYGSTRSAGRVITEVRTYTSCDCSSSTVASATASGHVPVASQSPSAHLHQGAIPVSSSSSSSSFAHVHQSAMPLSSSSTLAGAHSHVHGPASMYVSVPVSVPAPTGVDAQGSGYPSSSGRKVMASSSSFGVPSASASARPSPSPSSMTFDGGASVGVFVPSSVVMVGLTAIMAFFM